MLSSIYIHSGKSELGSELQAMVLPDVKSILPAAQFRRTSRLIKASLGIATQALQSAEAQKLQGIVVATGLGCLEDTIKFLDQSIDKQENDILSPTAFIHSTHNSISGQLALYLNCQGWNSTFSQRYLSWYSALLETILLLESAIEPTTYLTLAADECLPSLVPALKTQVCFQTGFIGEGVTAWVLSNQKKKDVTQLLDIQIVQSKVDAITKFLTDYLQSYAIPFSAVHALISNVPVPGIEIENIDSQFITGNYFTAPAAQMELANRLLIEKKSGYVLTVFNYLDYFMLALIAYVES